MRTVELASGRKRFRYILIVCRLMVAMPSGKRETEVRKGNASVNTSLSPNGDGRANNLVEEADGHSRGSGPLQITATGEQVTSCYNIGNGPRPSRTPLALGFCLGILNFYPSRSYGIYEFDVAEDDSSIFLPSVFDGCTFIDFYLTPKLLSTLMGRYRPLWLPLT
ncbi:hypothetical protein T09_10638 [Trichinella sp. T9]|nr:hypothetical protein T09_10638 [Trichinella sp. T9]